MELLPQGQTNSTEVTWNDQQNINKFSTLITQRDRLDSKLKALITEKEYIDDVSMELELIDEDEKLDYKIGESFVVLKQSEIMEKLELETGRLDIEINSLEIRIEQFDHDLSDLKKILYAKFGTSINLER